MKDPVADAGKGAGADMFPDFVKEFPDISYKWAVFENGKFLLYLTTSFKEIALLMLTYRCFVDTQTKTIDLL